MKTQNILPIPTLIVLLGGQAIINREIRHDFDLIEIAKEGLPKQALDSLAKQIAFSNKEMAEVLNISERTIQRYRDDHRLDKDASAKLIRLAKLYELGQETFGSLERFNGWMHSRVPALGGKRPTELLDTSLGYEIIERELIYIEHGLFS
ncbi:putative toxin-antitoxin system antitoxin component (TIGR02293 family) [Arcicella rosea]|uniref:type II RES/Xre toxin-antitoxin system antitoxin n=1 Tax=Arcicella rosea TaxID=502909 RepID=UPI00345C6F4A